MEYLYNAVITTAIQLLIILGPGLLLSLIMNFVSKIIERKATGFLGIKLYLLLFGWLGTTVHESGHAIFCLIFRHKINEIKFFSPDLDSGTLGYVNHSYNPKSIYQTIGNFFIGIGPIILGALVIYLATYILSGHLIEFAPTQNIDNAPPASIIEQMVFIFKQIFNWSNLTSLRFYIFIYICFAVGGSINLSPADLRGATKGLLAITLFLFILNLATSWLGKFDYQAIMHSNFFAMFYLIMIMSIIVNIISALLIPPFLKLKY
jgi:hypothetical protein